MLCIRKSRSPTQLYTFNLGKFHMVWYEHEKSSKCTIFTVNCILLHFIAWKNIILNEVLRIVYSFIQSQIFKIKGHIFWEGHKNFSKSSPNFWLQYIRSKVKGRFRKILWPSQNIWTLPAKAKADIAQVRLQSYSLACFFIDQQVWQTSL